MSRKRVRKIRTTGNKVRPLIKIYHLSNSIPRPSIKINWDWIIGTKDQKQLVRSCQTNFLVVPPPPDTQFNFFHSSEDRVGSGRSKDPERERDSQENFNNRRTFQSGEHIDGTEISSAFSYFLGFSSSAVHSSSLSAIFKLVISFVTVIKSKQIFES